MFIQQVQLFANAISTAVTNILRLHVFQSVTVRELLEHVTMIMSQLKIHSRKLDNITSGRMRQVRSVKDHRHAFGGQE